ncbi:MAG: cytochrome c maturation protein CcmE [Candidatus Krumholzibacteriia bacterium]
MQARVKLGIGIGVILLTLAWLAVTGFRAGRTYYYTVDEIAAGTGLRPDARLKVSGEVVPGSIVRRAAGLAFTLTENGRELPVLYAGLDPVPDTFKDRAKAIVEGRLQPGGTFAADRIQAKCASRYEAMSAGEPAP